MLVSKRFSYLFLEHLQEIFNSSFLALQLHFFTPSALQLHFGAFISLVKEDLQGPPGQAKAETVINVKVKNSDKTEIVAFFKMYPFYEIVSYN